MRTGLIGLLLFGCPGDVTPPATPLPPPACPVFDAGEPVGRVPSPPASEISGVAVAPDGRLFVHNDSGDPAEVHVLTPDGGFLGTWTLTGVDAIDFEDIAIGPGPNGAPFVWVGDIGDNNAERTNITVYRFPLPAEDGGELVPERLDLTYGDGPRNAETLFVDGAGSLWIASKSMDGDTGLYRLVLPRPGPAVLDRVLSLQFGEPPLGQNRLVTGGDWSERGLVLRTYVQTAFIWPINPDEELLPALQRPPCTVFLRPEFQPEAIAWTADGLVTITEGNTPNVNVHQLQ